MLFGLAIKKSNVKADLMQIELSGTEIDFVGTQIRNRHSLLTSPYENESRWLSNSNSPSMHPGSRAEVESMLNEFKLCFNNHSTFLVLSRMLNEVEAVCH